jgi:hypothetical protein
VGRISVLVLGFCVVCGHNERRRHRRNGNGGFLMYLASGSDGQAATDECDEWMGYERRIGVYGLRIALSALQ